MRIPPIETRRLVVREVESGDLAGVSELLGGSRARWLDWTRMGYEQLAEMRQPPYGDRAVVRRDSGRLAGLVGLVPSLAPFGLLPGWPEGGDRYRPEVGLYWSVLPEHRRQGIAAEAAAALIDVAFAELRLARVVATTEHANTASIGVMRRLGMRIERNPQPQPEWFQVVGILEVPGRDG